MQNFDTAAFKLDTATCSLVAQLEYVRTNRLTNAVLSKVERLRRMEDEVRRTGATRQTLQTIASTRRVLGDHAGSRRFEGPFLDE